MGIRYQHVCDSCKKIVHVGPCYESSFLRRLTIRWGHHGEFDTYDVCPDCALDTEGRLCLMFPNRVHCPDSVLEDSKPNPEPEPECYTDPLFCPKCRLARLSDSGVCVKCGYGTPE